MKCIRCIPDSSCYAINDGREFVNPSADEQWHGDKCLFSPRLAEAWEFPTEHTCQSTIFVVVWKHPPWLLSNKIRSVRSRWLDCRDIYEIRAAIPFFDSERALVPLLFNACWCLDSILWHWIVPPYLEIYTTHKSKVPSILSHSQIRSLFQFLFLVSIFLYYFCPPSPFSLSPSFLPSFYFLVLSDVQLQVEEKNKAVKVNLEQAVA